MHFKKECIIKLITLVDVYSRDGGAILDGILLYFLLHAEYIFNLYNI